jgi:LPS sulfotransferase NodH
MIDGAETGYEEKFDFPAWQGLPARPWLLATVPRTGSTFVSHMLWATGCLGAPLEYLNFEPAGPYGHAAANPSDQHRIWRRVLARRTSPNGVFGLKAFPLLMEDLHRMNPPLTAEVMRLLVSGGREARVVQLRRRDTSAQAVSYARALLSGVWRKEQERDGLPEPEFSRAAYDSARGLIACQEQAWQDMCASLDIEPLVLWYEDCLAEPGRAVRQVANYLGVAVDPAAAVRVPQIERQAPGGNEAWIAHLAAEEPSAPPV